MLQIIVQWTSDLKCLASTFSNYLWSRIIADDSWHLDNIPEINDVYHTNLLNAVTGKKSCFSQYFDEFAMKYKIKYYIPWMTNTSQIICHIKNEMTTMAKNNITLNFERRMKSTIRWRVLNFLYEIDEFNIHVQWKHILNKVTK